MQLIDQMIDEACTCDCAERFLSGDRAFFVMENGIGDWRYWLADYANGSKEIDMSYEEAKTFLENNA